MDFFRDRHLNLLKKVTIRIPLRVVTHNANLVDVDDEAIAGPFDGRGAQTSGKSRGTLEWDCAPVSVIALICLRTPVNS